MEKEYCPKNIEPYVQQYWKDNKVFHVYEDDKKEKYYCLPMLPYPSGKLHMGHVRNYTISDVISRYQRMLGKNVLQPIGWDAFGLPAEEAAIKNKTKPSDWTQKNIKYMKKQLQSLGFSYDWSREITTCKPDYYCWEQWFFIQLYKKKLVYKKNSFVNWCPYDKTVLANEQVIKGCCWRCQNKIKVKKIPQWFIKIRNYAESLHNDLNDLENWPEKVKNMQRNWIGRSKGFEIVFNVLNSNKKIKAFTNRLDLIMGATYISISPCHEFSVHVSKEKKEIQKFIDQKINNSASQEDIEKIKFEGINSNMFVIHPITNKKIPVWISNFIQKEYGTNAIISVPGHNQNDWNFSIKHNLKIKYVIKNKKYKNTQLHNLFTTEKGILYNSGEFNNLNYHNATEKIKKTLLKKKIIKEKINYKLQDWCISRQRYWGTPIPMATKKNGEIIAIPEKNLPVLLPEIKNYSDSLQKPMDSSSKWANIKIENQDVIRETDTFDTFMESSWYYARYTCPNFNTGMIDPTASKYWLPVDQYIGGIEHATMHLIYFRFYHKLLRDFKLVELNEPVKNLICQGMVLSEAFYQFDKNNQRNWIHPSCVQVEKNLKGETIKVDIKNKKKVIYAGMIKMSKSKNNGIEPELMINRYGADTLRLFIMFAAPIESSLEWRESGVKGIYRFLKKIWKLVFNHIEVKKINKKVNFDILNKKQKKMYCLLHKTIIKVSDDIGRRKSFNTAISSIMELVNELSIFKIENEEDKSIIKESLMSIIKMLYPFTPHFCFRLWQYLNKNCCIDYETWPTFEKKILSSDKNTLIIQINGKKQCAIEVKNHLNKEEILSYIENQSIIQKKIKNLKIIKIIYIPQKVINFVV
ncbi:leucine--tRNA ligase [Buchnera aphidicola]|jgi:leucyl-tRNA synthetase|uniref:Leucine--tRNA ligase n=1 Tax=Buchnera aphidicola subsp. Schizaphis graminum (strain Sg) TaxID=198804 RepID=SYL_BUCAP|nr:leucine--tRNA ligase [Buchnera aphidicola]Q8K9B9.1 RecName: Full=Leucine--tRNA ligase; AltName: Full=Leucyl-tRNA synthetase; Short=LeuRS [Buchnera aphidicola str. Sg (Schizaphis graminum)]AAM67972.1 leucyl-tRNA synthetase [Buchnera aphidicola str. Sg (Schizaphis graminum)]AWI49534.1 leucine--tRNA ligase [Buchnera aphidicola (Schizaphis graminum)]